MTVLSAASGRVTAKDETNLRAEPSTDGKLIATIKNGEFVEKTGESPKGWTRLLYNGQTVYAKTSLLTTEVKKPAASSETPSTADEFVAATGKVTAKDIVNLRSAPNGKEDNIVCQLKKGRICRTPRNQRQQGLDAPFLQRANTVRRFEYAYYRGRNITVPKTRCGGLSVPNFSISSPSFHMTEKKGAGRVPT